MDNKVKNSLGNMIKVKISGIGVVTKKESNIKKEDTITKKNFK